jgi:polyisoprenoid-binding protein YceI
VTQGKLNGHLKSEDFGTEKFPTSTLVFKTVAASKNIYAITADLSKIVHIQ